MNEQELHDKTMKCIRCGFCLEACPTFVVTGQETESPRGRIYLVRSAIEGEIDWQDAKEHLDSCLGCRACEPACPSGVEYGQILELARSKSELQPNIATKTLLNILTSPKKLKLMLAGSKFIPGKRIPFLISKALSGTKSEADHLKPEKPIDIIPSPKHPQRTVYLLEGCIMGTAFAASHNATINLLHKFDCKVVRPQIDCCGSLHLHAGELEQAKQRAMKLIDACANDWPILTNSAGCGSAMKEYALLFPNDPRAEAFSKRVMDISEYLAQLEPPQPIRKSNSKVAYHDACHLAHGQRITKQPRDLIQSVCDQPLIEIKESDRCCGSAGIYNLTQPEIARQLLDRKWRNIEESKAEIIVTGNPGCLSWIRQAAREKKSAVRVMHTAEFLWESYEEPS